MNIRRDHEYCTLWPIPDRKVFSEEKIKITGLNNMQYFRYVGFSVVVIPLFVHTYIRALN